MKIEPDPREVRRYLGYGQNEPDAVVKAVIEECTAMVCSVAQPKYVYKILPLHTNADIVQIGEFVVKSRQLGKNLKDCRRIVLFGATLGAQVDRLIKRYSGQAMSQAVVAQAAAAALIEAYCDACQREIEAECNAQGQYIRPRFSPGYGDFPLTCQTFLTTALDCYRRIGVSLTEGLLLAPSKSVTAVMGVSDTKENCHRKGCEACSKIDCSFRREG